VAGIPRHFAAGAAWQDGSKQEQSMPGIMSKITRALRRALAAALAVTAYAAGAAHGGTIDP